MNRPILESIIACPKCKTALKPTKDSGKCKNCGIQFRKKNGIWHLLYLKGQQSKTSSKSYDILHRDIFGGPNDGSYEILASMARGNKTVDIACGEGLIEKLSPKTVGVEFSLNALKKAKKNGAKYLVLADSHALPFVDNAFDVAICAGSLEHFSNPQTAINEMARVSKIQVLTVHRYPPFPFASTIYEAATKLLRIPHQPIEQPISKRKLLTMLKNAKLSVVFEGVWTLPFNYGLPIKILPEIKSIPSSWFIISIKKNSKIKIQKSKLQFKV